MNPPRVYMCSPSWTPLPPPSPSNPSGNSCWAISNSEKWCCESVALSMPANLENSAVATGLEKVSFHPIPKKDNAKNAQTTTQLYSSHMLGKWCLKFSRQASEICEPWNSRCSSWFWKRQRNQRSKCQHPLDHWRAREFQKNPISVLLTMYIFNFYAEYIMRNAGLEEAWARIKMAGGNINNLRYPNGTTLMTESVFTSLFSSY